MPNSVTLNSLANGRRSHWLAALPLALAAFCLLFVRAGLGFQFPVPWPDETQFISPAYNLARHGTMFDPGLQVDRILMAMPPGYSVLLAAVFKLFGYSYSLARWVSTVCMLGALAIAGRIAWAMPTPNRRIAAAWVVGIAFASPSVLLSSNFGRMEALVCVLILGALSAGLSGRFYVMASLVVLTATVHFNAVYFVPAVFADFCARGLGGRLRWPDRLGWIMMGLTAAAVAAFGVFIAYNLDGFHADMAEQFRIKAALGRMRDPSHPRILPLCALALLAMRAGLAFRIDRSMLLSLFGAGFVVMPYFGHELWYDYGQPVGFMLLALGALEGLPSGRGRRVILAQATLGAAVILSATIAARVSIMQRPLMFRPDMIGRDFVKRGEIKHVRQFIATLHPGDKVDFGFTGMENFFLPDLARVGAQWTWVNQSLFHPLPFRSSDWRVSCDSSDLSAPILQFEMTIHRVGKDTGCSILPGLDPNKR